MSDQSFLPEHAQSADGAFLLAVASRQDSVRDTAPHSHARGQLFGAMSGLLSVSVEGARWVVPAVHAVWVPPHRLHAVRSHGPYAGWRVYVAESACADLPGNACTLRTTALLREAVRRATTWHGAPLDGPKTRVAQVIVDELRALPKEPLGLTLPRDARLLRITSALLEDLGDNRSLQAWAEWGALTPRTLTRRFLAETGFSFSAWRQQARVMRALEMLAAGTPVTRIALDLGYENVSAFIAMFKRTLGSTPGRYAEAANASA